MKTYTYYIYLIQGIKIGCTTDLQKRMADQGFTEWEILWQQEGDYEFGWTAGEKEIELQKLYGLPVDKVNYQISRMNRPMNMNIGQWNKITGNLSNIAKQINQNKEHQIKASLAAVNGGNHPSRQVWLCPDGFKTSGIHYKKYCNNRGLDYKLANRIS